MFASHHSAPSAQRAGLLLVAGKALLQILSSMARTFPSMKTNCRTAPQTFTANILGPTRKEGLMNRPAIMLPASAQSRRSGDGIVTALHLRCSTSRRRARSKGKLCIPTSVRQPEQSDISYKLRQMGFWREFGREQKTKACCYLHVFSLGHEAIMDSNHKINLDQTDKAAIIEAVMDL